MYLHCFAFFSKVQHKELVSELDLRGQFCFLSFQLLSVFFMGVIVLFVSLLRPFFCSDAVRVTGNSISPASLPAGCQVSSTRRRDYWRLEPAAKPRGASLCLCLFQQPLFVTLASTRHSHSQCPSLDQAPQFTFCSDLVASELSLIK